MDKEVIIDIENPKDNDLISRSDAIRGIEKRAKRIKNADTLNGLAGAVGILFDLPSLKPQEKTGHWRRISMDKYSEHAKYWYRCDRCGKDNLGNTDWCPNCGARMVEPQESEG